MSKSVRPDADSRDSGVAHPPPQKLAPSDLAVLFANLKSAGYDLIGPRVSDGIIALASLEHPDEMPRGVTDSQKPAEYRLSHSDKPHYFAHVLGPHSFKRFTFPPRHTLFSVTRDGGEIKFAEKPPDAPKYAFVGIRSCEIAALGIQDRVFDNDQFSDQYYAARRKDNFILAVNCTHPAETCFCVSMGTGPAATKQFDLAMTEVCDKGTHFFVLYVGSELGASMMKGISEVEASAAEKGAAESLVKKATANMQRTLPTKGLKKLLYDNAESRQWDEVGSRCLACTSCTMVCPTCFCSTVEDSTNLSGSEATRTRTWDSCFNEDYSYIHGGSVRTSQGPRYRHWITHKLATWQDQFDIIGCVGCGRCITWCPSGIDLTEEIAELRKKRSEKKKVLVKE